MQREEFNAVEVVLMTHMLSFYYDVTNLVENLFQKKIQPNDYAGKTVEKLAKVLVAKEEVQEKEMEAPVPPALPGAPQARAAANSKFGAETSLIISTDQIYEEIFYHGNNNVNAHLLQYRFNFFHQILLFLLQRKDVPPLSIFEVLVNGTHKEQLFALMMCPKSLFDSIYLSTKKPEQIQVIDYMTSKIGAQFANVESLFKCETNITNADVKINQCNII